MRRHPPTSTLFPYTTLFRSAVTRADPIVNATPRPISATHSTNWRPLLRSRTIRSEEHTSELQSRVDLVCRLLLEKKNLDGVPPDERVGDPPDRLRGSHPEAA